MLAVLSLLMSMTVVTPARAENFYTGTLYVGWVIAGEDFRGIFGDPESALQKFWESKCTQNCGYIYIRSEIGPNLFQWDGYWGHPVWPAGTIQYISSAIPLLSCPPGFKLGEFLSAASGSVHLGYGSSSLQIYNAATLGLTTQGYAVCYRKTDAADASPNRVPGPPLGGSCTAGDTAAVGNPCNAGTGNKYEHEVDHGGNAASALRFERFYNSVPAPAGLFGAKWRSNFDRRLLVHSITSGETYQFPDNATLRRLGMQWPTIRSVALERPDGKTYWFSQWYGGAWQTEPDLDGTLSSTASGWDYSTRDGVTESYDASGRLTVISDRNGLTQTLSYNGDNLVRVTDSFGRSLNFSYDSSGRLRSMTDPASNNTQYSYDTYENLARIDYPDGTARLYHYEDTRFPQHLTGISHANSNGELARYSTFGYNVAGLASFTEHAGGIGRFTLNYDYPTQTTVTDATGSKEQMTFIVRLGAKLLSSRSYVGASGRLSRLYDSVGRVTCRGDRDGRATKYTYTATGQLSSKTEGLNGGASCGTTTDTAARTTTYQYLSTSLDLPTVIESPSVFGGNTARITIGYSGNLPTSISQSGFTASGTAVSRDLALGYNSYGQVISIDGPRTDIQDITTLTYNECASGGACGQLHTFTNALGQITTFNDYDAAGRLLEITDPNGLKTNYQYDARGRVRFISHTPASGSPRLSEYRYTAAGDVAFVALPEGRTLNYEYNAARLLTSISDNLGNRITYGYDLKGNRTAEYTYDSSGTLQNQIDIAYEARNNVSQINYGGSVTKFVTDAVGNVMTEYDPNTVAVNGSSSTRSTFDRLNRMLLSINKVYGYTYYAYDINSNIKQVKTPNNAITTYAYDDLGNLLTETSPDRGTTVYTYDTAGNLRTLTDARGITASYGYDALNRIATVSYNNGSENIAYTHDTCSNGVGRLCRVQDAAGVSDYTYDGFGNVVTHARAELGVVYTTRYSYDAGNRVTGITYPNGRLVNYTRDTKGNIQSASMTLHGVTTALVTGNAYRPDGLPTSRVFGNNLADTRVYSTQGQLREMYLGNADTRLYAYDANGNLTGLQTLPQVGAYQYDVLDRLKKEDRTTQGTVTTTWTYDTNGNRKAQNAGTYAYLANSNRLTTATGNAITLDAAGNTLSDGLRSYTYNNAGQLSTVAGAGYSYNAQRQRSRKIVGSQATVYHYDLTGNLIAETDADGNLIRDFVWADSTPIAQIEAGEKIAYLHTDHLNTPRLATNTQGQVIWRWEGTVFGETLANEDVDGDGIKTTINLRFPGQYYDSETGLYYNWNRYYDPKIGRYITSDPIGLRGGLNTYSYALNNPLRWVDPTGEASCFFSLKTGRVECWPAAGGTSVLNIPAASGNNTDANKSCRNNSACEDKTNVGPIPRGCWVWSGEGRGDRRNLSPMPGSNDKGRTDIQSHSCAFPFGPGTNPDTVCSKGCVTSTTSNIEKLNKLIDSEPGSILCVIQ